MHCILKETSPEQNNSIYTNPSQWPFSGVPGLAGSLYIFCYSETESDKIDESQIAI